MSKEKPHWYPELTDEAFLNRLREEYPDDADKDDEELRYIYDCESKYATTWDHIGDAYEDYEPLCDAFLEQAKQIETQQQKMDEVGKALEKVKAYTHRLGYVHGVADKALTKLKEPK